MIMIDRPALIEGWKREHPLKKPFQRELKRLWRHE